MTSENGLLEFYQQHREEIDILSDKEALFVLAFIQHIDSTISLQDLAKHLGWGRNKLVLVCTKLQNNNMIRIQNLQDPMAEVQLLRSGKDLLRIFSTVIARGNQEKKTELTPSQKEELKKDPFYNLY